MEKSDLDKFFVKSTVEDPINFLYNPSMKKIPNTYVIVFFIIVLAAASTWLIPGGKYETVTTAEGVSQKVYKSVENNPQSWQIFSAFYKGFERQAGIIVFILMIGGAFWIINCSKAIDAGINSFLNFTKRLEGKGIFKKIGVENIVLTLIMLMFSVFGAVFGMSEETIPFIIIVVPLVISMGYDSITGVLVVFVAAGLGFAGAVLNPFTIGIAQGLSDLPLYSGMEYRIVCWFVMNIIGIAWILKYAHKVKKSPEKSLVYEEDEYWREKGRGDGNVLEYVTPKMSWYVFGAILLIFAKLSFTDVFTTLKIGDASVSMPFFPVITLIYALGGYLTLKRSVHFYILFLLAVAMGVLIVGVMGYGWHIMEIATLFFSLGIISGAASGYSPDKIVKFFIEGVKDFLSAALVVGFAGGIIIILEDGMVIDTILNSLAGMMDGMGGTATVGAMYVIQTGINLFIPSASAKAALTMPIMAPFSDLVGISRQATVMAYQFGDGFTNMITPISPVMIAVIGVARIPYEKWFKWIFPFILVFSIIGFLLLIPTVTMNLNGF